MFRFKINLLFLVNDILLILYMRYLADCTAVSGIEKAVPFFIATVILTDITYIDACNVKENKVVFLFCGLLALDCWYILSAIDTGAAADLFFPALCPCIWYASILFVFLFLFQGSAYRYRRAVNVILAAACLSALAGLWISDRAFAVLYGLQLFVYIVCFVFVTSGNYKRVAFVLKSEKRHLLFSSVTVLILFVGYYAATIGIKGHINNFGVYLTVLMFFLSIHVIVWKEHNSIPLSTLLPASQLMMVIAALLSVSVVVCLLSGGGYEELLISVNIAAAVFYICNIIWEYRLKNYRSANREAAKESKYNMALQWLWQEENLKKEFADFLHDDVLQDLLSVKNLMDKAQRPDIQAFITQALEHLNTRIREQMQDYHPVILKKLSMKENLCHLIEDVSQSFLQCNIRCSFDCPDDLFLVEPYDVLIYRMMKELLTNVYKHSDAERAWITLLLENDIIELNVSDNGSGDTLTLALADRTEHKGIASMKEQAERMGGTFRIMNGMPHGVCVQVRIPMKGDVSYQYFVS